MFINDLTTDALLLFSVQKESGVFRGFLEHFLKLHLLRKNSQMSILLMIYDTNSLGCKEIIFDKNKNSSSLNDSYILFFSFSDISVISLFSDSFSFSNFVISLFIKSKIRSIILFKFGINSGYLLESNSLISFFSKKFSYY